MNDKFGTTKLLPLSRDAKSASSVLEGAVAVRLGVRSSSIALVDTTDEAKLLIFQITYTEDSHRDLCLGFLSRGEDNAKIQTVFVNREVPEFAKCVPDLVDRVRIVDYAEQLHKSAQLLFDLSESHGDILYDPSPDGCKSSDKCIDACFTNCILIDSSEAGTCITKVNQQQQQQQQQQDQGLKQSSKNLPEAHKTLEAARQKLIGLLPDARTEGESADIQLAYLLHNMSLSEQSDEFQSAFSSCVRPALQEYIGIINAEADANCTVYLCDCIFSSAFCRQALLWDYSESVPGCKIIRFVNDSGLLGFLGALTACN